MDASEATAVVIIGTALVALSESFSELSARTHSWIHGRQISPAPYRWMGILVGIAWVVLGRMMLIGLGEPVGSIVPLSIGLVLVVASRPLAELHAYFYRANFGWRFDDRRLRQGYVLIGFIGTCIGLAVLLKVVPGLLQR
jgi:hypothetical protein